MLRVETLLQVVGGLFLLGLGLRTWFSKPQTHEQEGENISVALAAAMARVFAITFVLTITNPATMLGFIAIFGGVAGLASAGDDYAHAATVVVAVAAGSLLWWASVSSFVSLFRARMDDRLLGLVNRVSGGLIVAFGIVVLGRVVAMQLF